MSSRASCSSLVLPAWLHPAFGQLFHQKAVEADVSCPFYIFLNSFGSSRPWPVPGGSLCKPLRVRVDRCRSILFLAAVLLWRSCHEAFTGLRSPRPSFRSSRAALEEGELPTGDELLEVRASVWLRSRPLRPRRTCESRRSSRRSCPSYRTGRTSWCLSGISPEKR